MSIGATWKRFDNLNDPNVGSALQEMRREAVAPVERDPLGQVGSGLTADIPQVYCIKNIDLVSERMRFTGSCTFGFK